MAMLCLVIPNTISAPREDLTANEVTDTAEIAVIFIVC